MRLHGTTDGKIRRIIKNKKRESERIKAGGNMRRKITFGILISLLFISIIIFVIYRYYPLMQTAKANRSMDIAGIRLLMPLDEVLLKMGGEGEYIYGMGGFGHEFKNEKIKVFFSNDPESRAYNRVSSIEIENPEHHVFDMKPGDSKDKAVSTLNKLNFEEKESNYYEKGDLFIVLNFEKDTVKKIKIGFLDRLLKDRVY